MNHSFINKLNLIKSDRFRFIDKVFKNDIRERLFFNVAGETQLSMENMTIDNAIFSILNPNSSIRFNVFQFTSDNKNIITDVNTIQQARENVRIFSTTNIDMLGIGTPIDAINIFSGDTISVSNSSDIKAFFWNIEEEMDNKTTIYNFIYVFGCIFHCIPNFEKLIKLLSPHRTLIDMIKFDNIQDAPAHIIELYKSYSHNNFDFRITELYSYMLKYNFRRTSMGNNYNIDTYIDMMGLSLIPIDYSLINCRDQKINRLMIAFLSYRKLLKNTTLIDIPVYAEISIIKDITDNIVNIVRCLVDIKYGNMIFSDDDDILLFNEYHLLNESHINLKLITVNDLLNPNNANPKNISSVTAYGHDVSSMIGYFKVHNQKNFRVI